MMRTPSPTGLRSNLPHGPTAALAGALSLLVPLPAMAGGGIGGTGALSLESAAVAGPHTCADATRSAEIAYGLPPGLMTAIATVESGRFDPVLQANLAWPWTINAEGAGSHFDSKADAVSEVTDLLAGGMESIDVGCMQVNLRWHPDAFASLDDAFDPAVNADYAARLLLRLFEQHGDWPTAIGYYHSPTDWRQENYQAKVAEAWAGLGGSFAGLPVALAETPAAPTGPVLFGGLVAAGGPTLGAAPAAGFAGAGGLLGAAGPAAAGPAGGALAVTAGSAAAAQELRFFPLEPR